MTHRCTDIIFDFDGTLVDSAPGILAAFGAVLRDRNIPPRQPLTEALIGPPLTETLALLTGWSEDSRLTPLTEEFKRSYDSEGIRATPPYDGVETMLKTLRRSGARLHIATNKRLSPTRLIIEHLGWGDYFTSIYALDMREPRVPSKAALIGELMAAEGIASDSTCYVGDRIEDGEAADAQPIPFFFVDWGYGAEELRPHWMRVATPQELVDRLGLA